MPAYNSNTIVTPFSGSAATPPNADQGKPILVFNNEVPTAGEASQQVALPANPAGLAKAISVFLAYALTPGVFEVDVETADIDDDSHYVKIATINSGLNAAFVTRTELPQVCAKFIRLRSVTNTNAVHLTAGIVRHY